MPDGVPKLHFEIDVSTCWSSIYRLLKSVIKIKGAISSLYLFIASPKGKEKFQNFGLCFYLAL